jgi:hypothetical protein
VLLFQITENWNIKVKSLAPHPLLFIPQRKLKQAFETHIEDRVRHAKCLNLFTIRATQCPTNCEWGLGPLINSVGPPGVVE